MVDTKQSIAMAWRGRTYKGVWYVCDGEVHVECGDSHRSADLPRGEHEAQLLAETMFRQLVRMGAGDSPKTLASA